MTAADYWKPNSADFIENPVPYYKEIRKFGSVFRSKSEDYVVVGYNACKEVLQNPECIVGSQYEKTQNVSNYANKKGEDLSTLAKTTSGMLIQMNGPEHIALRSALSKAWPGRETLKLIISQSLDQIVEDLPDSFEAMEVLCKKLPVSIICSLLGLDPREALLKVNDSLKLILVLDPYISLNELREINQIANDLHNFIEASINHEHYVSTPLVDAVIKSTNDLSGINPVSVLMFLFMAGFETTSTLLATCLRELILNKTYLEQIQDFGIQPFAKEMMRIHAPVRITGRKTRKEMELGGVHIPKNASLTLCLGAANLDPEHFNDPESIHWNRKKYEHLSFGFGMHHCLGSTLTELEAEGFIERLIPIIPKMELKSPPTYENKFTIHSFRSLDVMIN